MTAAFNEYSERYAVEVFESSAGGRGVKRVYWEGDLHSAYKGIRSPMLRSTTEMRGSSSRLRQPRRPGTLSMQHRLRAPESDRKKIAKEALQASQTIDSIRQNEAALTGSTRGNPVRFYPVVVLTEGFPNNPLVTSRLREELRAQNILVGADTAPLEILDLAELDMIEGVGETTAQTLVEILREKERSNFHADSVRIFLVGDPRFVPQRPARVTNAFQAFLERMIAHLGGDPHQFDWTTPTE